LTRTGDTSVSRIGAVLMHRVGLPEFITQTPEDYVSRAIEIASDLPALNGIRQGLRERMSTQAAMDPNVFIGHVENAFRKMWQCWCDTQLSQSK
jgi:protein O-GlcNAc transferase